MKRFLPAALAIALGAAAALGDDAETYRKGEAQRRNAPPMKVAKEWSLAPLTDVGVAWVSADEKTAYVSSADAGSFVDLSNGKLTDLLSKLREENPALKSARGTDVKVSPTGKWFALQSGPATYIGSPQTLKAKKIHEAAGAVKWLGDKLLVTDGEKITAIDPATEKAGELPLKGKVSGTDPGGRALVVAVGGAGKPVHTGVYAPDGKQIFPLGDIAGISGYFSATGKMICVLGPDNALSILNTAGGKAVWSRKGVQTQIYGITDTGDLVEDSDNAILYVAGKDGPKIKIREKIGNGVTTATAHFAVVNVDGAWMLQRFALPK